MPKCRKPLWRKGFSGVTKIFEFVTQAGHDLEAGTCEKMKMEVNMKRLADREICNRVVKEVEAMATRNRTSIAREMARLRINPVSYYNWRRCTAAPGAFPLSVMAENGYDVLYILTGRRS